MIIGSLPSLSSFSVALNIPGRTSVICPIRVFVNVVMAVILGMEMPDTVLVLALFHHNLQAIAGVSISGAEHLFKPDCITIAASSPDYLIDIMAYKRQGRARIR